MLLQEWRPQSGKLHGTLAPTWLLLLLTAASEGFKLALCRNLQGAVTLSYLQC